VDGYVYRPGDQLSCELMLRYFPIEYDAFARWPGTLEVTSLLFPFNVTSIHPSMIHHDSERREKEVGCYLPDAPLYW
jgi:hypothetical protein